VFKTVVIVILAVVIGAGGALGGTQLLSNLRSSAQAATIHKVPPTYFAQLDDIVVSLPPQTGQPATSYVNFGIQFATHDPNAVTAFGALQPIVRSKILSVLMAQTAQGLQDQATRGDIVLQCLDIANTVVEKNANFITTPFAGGYITDLVVQDDGG
jgi:flagellar basal body-associated protein FliL